VSEINCRSCNCTSLSLLYNVPFVSTPSAVGGDLDAFPLGTVKNVAP
jgi:hypothetical protein